MGSQSEEGLSAGLGCKREMDRVDAHERLDHHADMSGTLLQCSLFPGLAATAVTQLRR